MTRTHVSLRTGFGVLVLAAGVVALGAPAGAQVPQGPPPPMALETIELPPGFTIGVFADNVPSARSLALGENGTVFVGTFGFFSGNPKIGDVYAVRDNDGDHKADEVVTIATRLNSPNGVAFRNGSLYVAEIGRVIRFDDIESRLRNPPAPALVKDGLPTDFLHQWRYLKFGPDGKLYFAVGAPCNVCEREDPYASIVRMNADGTGFEVFARGVRNSVGFDWHPETGDLWFTDNGRDMLGDNLPSDELNVATEAGQHFGYPYCHQGEVEDPEFGKPGVCASYRPPAVKMGPHVAAIGMSFYTGDMFPDHYKNQLFVAQHGSWNRSQPNGYRVALVHVQDGRASGHVIFAEGWLQGDQPWGRPVDILQMPDGSLLVSDDRQGVIYRISYQAP